MSVLLKMLSVLLCMLMIACGGSSDEENETTDEGTPAEDSETAVPDEDSEPVSDTDSSAGETDEDQNEDDNEKEDSENSDADPAGNDSETTDDDSAHEELQTGGIYIFSNFDGSGNAESREILGNGGFLGFSIFSLGEKYWAVSALHESIPAFDWDKSTGRLYIFEKNKHVESLEDAAFVLNHPEKSLNAGFGYTAAAPCDINGDGFDDLVVSSHLAVSGEFYAAGEAVVFYGSPDGWNEETFSISSLSSAYMQKADSMTQSLACFDYDGDGFADLFAGGQNAGPDLPDGGSQGMVAFFKGSASGLSEHESWVMLPEVEEKAQYFGSSMLLSDLDGDTLPDLVISGWALKENDEAENSGGVYIYLGGTDWQEGPSRKIFGEAGTQFGSGMKIIEIGGKKYLAVIAPKEKNYGTVNFYDPAEDFAERGRFSFQSALSENGNISDFDTIKISEDTDLIIVGGKYFGGSGRIYCSTIKNKTVSEAEPCKFPPETPEGGFGNSVYNNRNGEIIVGMPEYIHSF